MKKTLALLFAAMAVSAQAADSITLHGITFGGTDATVIDTVTEVSFTTSGYYYIKNTPASGTNEAPWTGAGNNAKNAGGMYFESGSDLKFNFSGATTNVNYLYIADDILLKQSTNNASGQINWSGTGNLVGFTINATEGAWVDINANYGSVIKLGSMSSGTVYLNEYGTLSDTVLGTSNSIVATAIADYAAGTSYYSTSDDGYITRTLLSGDYSSWSELQDLQTRVNLLGVDSYTVTATSSGLSVTYAASAVGIPEPATATLSLLALAGLAARRRRK